MSSLKSKTLKGLFWSFADSFGAYFIKFGFSVAIARALSPSDYGLMGMIIIFIAIGNLLTEGGFSMALIQKKETTNTDFSTIFYFNLMVSTVIYLILFFFASTVANFYHEPILIKIIRVSALTIILGALSTIQTVILSKELNFKKQTYISWVAIIFSGTTGVIIAYNGFAVWALVFQTLMGTFIRLTGLWITSKWRPTLVFDWTSFKELYKYGYKIFLSGMSDILFNKIYFPLIGKYFSAMQLGFYTNANSFSAIIVKQSTIAYGRVLFPAMASIHTDKEKFNSAYLTVFRMLLFVIFPVSTIALLTVYPFVEFFLTSKWLPAVPYMQLFLIEGFFYALYMLNQNTFNALGKSDVSLRVEILKKILMFLSLLIAFSFGIRALIIGQIVSSFLAFIYSLFVIYSRLKIRITVLVFDILKLLIISVLIYANNRYILESIIEESSILLIMQVIVLPIFYFVLVYLFKVQSLYSVAEVFSKYLPSKVKQLINNRFVI